MMLISVADGKRHLRITDNDHDLDVQQKIAEASVIIIDYLKVGDDPPWTTEAETPEHVRAAIKLMLTHLYEHRGDNMETDERLWDAIGRILGRSRDPTLA